MARYSKSINVKVPRKKVVEALKKSLAKLESDYKNQDKLEKEYEKEHSKWLKTVAKKLKNETPYHIDKTFGYIELRYRFTSDLHVQEPIRKFEKVHDWKYVESKEELENAIRILSLSEDEFVSTGTYNSISRWL